MSARKVLPLLTAVALAWAGPVSAARGAAPASPCPSGQACLVVTWTGPAAGSQVVTAADIDTWHDIVNVSYPVKPARNIGPHDELIGSGLSIGALLGHLMTPIPVPAVHFTSTNNRLGQLSALSQADLADPSPFVGGLLPVVYVVGADDAIGYVRPMRNAMDVNNADVFQTDSQGVLRLTVHLTGALLTPTIHADTTSAQVRAPVKLWLSFAQPPGVSIVATWDFGDGTASVRAARPAHRWTAAGAFPVVVRVRGSDGSLGQSAPLLVTVGPAHHTQHHGRPGTGRHPDPHHPVTGPTQGDGHHFGGAATSQPGPSSEDGHAGAAHHQRQSFGNASTKQQPAHLALVSGTTIGSGPAASSSERNTIGGAAAARSGSPVGEPIPTWVVLLTMVIAILGLGAWSERGPRKLVGHRGAS